jgi:uncharacterized membrane protein YidH (DUF202 family)
MIHRRIATLALALMMCFLLLSHYDDPQFFLFHFYESLIYLAIPVMLFYFEDRWAYMLGILAPVAWLVLLFAIGGFSGMWRQLSLVSHFHRPDFAANLLGALAAVLSIVMVVMCANRWRREFSGLGKTASTFLISLAIVVAYYGVMVFWFLKWPVVS